MNYHPDTAQINVQGCIIIVLTHSAVLYVGRRGLICGSARWIALNLWIHTLRGNPWIHLWIEL